MNWLRAAHKVAEMQSPRACSRCGTVVAVDAGACGNCGLPRGAWATYESSRAEHGRAQASEPVPAPRWHGRICVCGAVLAPDAYSCGQCGRFGIELLAATAGSSAGPGRQRSKSSFAAPPLVRKSAIVGYLAAAAVLGTVALALGTAGAAGAPSRSATTGQVAAAGGTHIADASARPSLAAVDGPTSSAVASGSTADAAPTGLPTATAARPVPTATVAGPPAPTPTAVPSATSAPTSTAAPTAAPTDPPIFVSITVLPDVVTANSTVTLGAVTVPAASCQAKVKYHSGKLSLAPGFKKKQTADSAGKVSWVWTADADIGTTTATVSCKLKGNSASKDKIFVVI